MENQISIKREGFSTKFGAIAAAAGAAVGLGNIWNFPYLTGKNGGGAFIVIYIFCVLLIGLPIMISEFIIGKRGQKNMIGSFKALAPNTKWHWVGWFSVVACFLILGFYGVVAGWSFAHVVKAIGGIFNGLNAEQIGDKFTKHITHPIWPIFWHCIFMGATAGIVIFGIRKGIEKFSKIFMPVLFVLLIILAIRSITLQGASDGLKFIFQPDFSQVSAKTILIALGAAFFSIGVGNGVMVTFGSYLRRDTELGITAFQVSMTDTIIAIIAGIAIFPAVFALGFEPTKSSGLAFITVPAVFQSIPGGVVAHYFFTLVFFILLSIAALTSSVATLEVVVAYFTEEFKVKRRDAALVISGIMFLIGIPCALSIGAVKINLFGVGFFDFIIFLVEAIFLPVGGLMIVIFVGWRLKKKDIEETLSVNGVKAWYQDSYLLLIRFIVPVVIVAVLVKTFIDAF